MFLSGFLAAEQLDRLFAGFKQFEPISLAVGLFFLLMVGFILFTYVGAVNVDGVNYEIDPQVVQQKLLIRGLLVVGGILLVGISYYLAAFTWDLNIAQNALMLGIGFYLFAFGLFTQSWHSAYLGVSPQSEIWHQSSVLVDGDRILETIEDVSEMNHGQRIEQPIVIVGINSPALEWHLRKQDITTTPALSSGVTPEIIITNLTEAQLWGAVYTGQDFRLSTTPNWSWLTVREWLSWTIFHKAEITTDEVAILWVRTDLFPGQSGND